MKYNIKVYINNEENKKLLKFVDYCPIFMYSESRLLDAKEGELGEIALGYGKYILFFLSQ